MKEPLVIYIVGDNRSGTTLLDYLLSCHPEAVSVGEMHNLTEFYFQTGPKNFHNWSCSCGEPVCECDYWGAILKEVDFSKDFKTKISFQEPKSSYFSKSWQKENIKKALNAPKNIEIGKKVAENSWSLYKSIFEKTGKQIIIDSSKNAFQAYFLNKYKKGNIKFLLLERDIGAVAYSKLNRSKKLVEIGRRKEKSIYYYLIGAEKKLRENRVLVDIIGENNENKETVITIDYMELAKEPGRVISEIIPFLNLTLYTPPVLTNENEGKVLHTIGGSPSRYKKRKIEPDLRYKAYYKNKPMARLLKNILK